MDIWWWFVIDTREIHFNIVNFWASMIYESSMRSIRVSSFFPIYILAWISLINVRGLWLSNIERKYLKSTIKIKKFLGYVWMVLGGPGICITNYLCRYLLRIDGFYSNSYVILSPANNYTNLTWRWYILVIFIPQTLNFKFVMLFSIFSWM